MNRLLIAMMAAALATSAYARMPFDANQPSNEQMQKEVQATTGGPSTGATAGQKAKELAAQSNTPAVLQTTEERQVAVGAATNIAQAGAAAGKAANKLREQRTPAATPLTTTAEKQQAVAFATETHPHG